MPITIDGVVYRNLEDQVAYLTEGYNDLSVISTYMPSDVSAQNKLASRSYVDQAVTTVAAHYLTSDAEGDNFPTKAALLTGPYYYGAEEHDPDENDYAFVNADEEHDGLPSRYAFIGAAWQYQYSLQASSGVVDLTSAQTITGVKTFSNGIKIGSTDFHFNTTWNMYSFNNSLFINGNVMASNVFPVSASYDLGRASNKWRDLYLSGVAHIGNNLLINDLSASVYFQSTGDMIVKTTGVFRCHSNGASDLGSESVKWRDLYLSGNIVGSYKEANEVTISGNIATAHFNMDAATVNKIKYLEIYIGSDTIVSSFMIPVAAWNMSEWTTSTSIEAQPVPVSVMFNSNGLYVALSDTGSTSVQVFAKMI